MPRYDCHNIGKEIIAAIAQGKPVPRVPEGCPSNIEREPGGSGNIPLMMAIRRIVAGEMPETALLPYLREWGFRGERGGWIYWPWHLAAILVAYDHLANADVKEATRLWLRAQWGMLALGAVFWQDMWTDQGDVGQVKFALPDSRTIERGRIAPRYRSGSPSGALVVLSSGSRSITNDGDRGDENYGWWLENSLLGPMLGAAIGYRMFVEKTTPIARIPIDTEKKWWPLACAMHNRSRAGRLERWGLDNAEAATLHGLIHSRKPSETVVLYRKISNWLKPFKDIEGHGTAWIRGPKGILTFQKQTRNHVKAGQGFAQVITGTHHSRELSVFTSIDPQRADRESGQVEERKDGDTSIKLYMHPPTGRGAKEVPLLAVQDVVGEPFARFVFDENGPSFALNNGATEEEIGEDIEDNGGVKEPVAGTARPGYREVVIASGVAELNEKLRQLHESSGWVAIQIAQLGDRPAALVEMRKPNKQLEED